MYHIVKIEFKKTGVKFENADAAAAAFAIDQASATGVKESLGVNQAAIESGDLVQIITFNDTMDGFVLTRTWKDAKWEEVSKNTVDYPTLLNGWSRTIL